jgi:ferredoxin
MSLVDHGQDTLGLDREVISQGPAWVLKERVEMKMYRVQFPEHDDYPGLELPADAALAESLDASNSPVRFGCRTGICGTCLVEVTADAPMAGAAPYEVELLDILAEGNAKARLCCLVKLQSDVSIRILKP